MFMNNAEDFIVMVPTWFITIILLIPTIAPWLPCRFSLRRLLIATTLVAVVLGILAVVN
jgi:hypothetical protein